jgi:hypothetical protein
MEEAANWGGLCKEALIAHLRRREQGIFAKEQGI